MAQVAKLEQEIGASKKQISEMSSQKDRIDGLGGEMKYLNERYLEQVRLKEQKESEIEQLKKESEAYKIQAEKGKLAFQ
jgi:hypothetical protein